MDHAQVSAPFRTTVDLHNHNTISNAWYPFGFMAILSYRHGHVDDVGLVVANTISPIVLQHFHSSICIKQIVSDTQSLRRKPAQLPTTNPGFKLSDKIWALLLVIKLTWEQFNAFIQSVLRYSKSLTTNVVFNSLFTKPLCMQQNMEDISMAVSTQQKTKKESKGDRTSKGLNALFHRSSHHMSMHSQTKCQSWSPSLSPLKPNPHLQSMGKTTSAPAPPGPQGLSEKSLPPDTGRKPLFNHLQTAHANTFSWTAQIPAASDAYDDVVSLTNAYSNMDWWETKNNYTVLDLGKD